MAKKSTTKAEKKPSKKAKPERAAGTDERRKSDRRKSERRQGKSKWDATDTLVKLIESPLVADLLAVGATAAVAAITESRSGRKSDPTYKSSRALKAAAAAAASAIGRRLQTEVDEIRKVAKEAGAKRGA